MTQTLTIAVTSDYELEQVYLTLTEMGIANIIVDGNLIMISFDSLVTLARFVSRLGGKLGSK